MSSDNFEKALPAAQKRQPFRPYTVRFASGEQIEVDHPEALVMRAGVGVFLSVTGVPTLFDHESVSEVIGETGRRSA
jgi:hypothetical protein